MPLAAWRGLCGSVSGMRDGLALWGIPTLPVIWHPDCVPFLGPWAAADDRVKSATIAQEGYAMPFLIAPQDLVVVGNGCSAAIPVVWDYLRAKNVRTTILSGIWEALPGWRDCCVSATACDLVAAKAVSVILAEEGTNIHHAGPNGSHGRTRESRIQANEEAGILTWPIKRIVDAAHNRAFSGLVDANGGQVTDSAWSQSGGNNAQSVPFRPPTFCAISPNTSCTPVWATPERT